VSPFKSCLYIQVIIIEEKKNYQKSREKYKKIKKRDIDTQRERENNRRGAPILRLRTPCSMLSSSHIQPLFFSFFIPFYFRANEKKRSVHKLLAFNARRRRLHFRTFFECSVVVLLLLVASLSKIAGYILPLLLLKKEKEERGKRKLEIVCYCSL
jgi:hypothetical protein